MDFGQRFRNCLQAGMLFLLILLGIQASFFLAQTAETVAAAERELWRQSDAAARTQEAARDAIHNLGQSLVLEVDLLRRAVESEMMLTREMAHAHIDAALQLGDARLAETNRILLFTAETAAETMRRADGHMAELTDTAERLSSETIRTERVVAEIARQVGAEIEDLHGEFLDCEGLGPSCLQNQFFSTAGAVRRMAEQLETSVPLIAERAAEKLE